MFQNIFYVSWNVQGADHKKKMSQIKENCSGSMEQESQQFFWRIKKKWTGCEETLYPLIGKYHVQLDFSARTNFLFSLSRGWTIYGAQMYRAGLRFYIPSPEKDA